MVHAAGGKKYLSLSQHNSTSPAAHLIMTSADISKGNSKLYLSANFD